MDVRLIPSGLIDINSSRDVVETSIQNEIYYTPVGGRSSTLLPYWGFLL